jgi:hypothetical protein
MKDRRRVVDAKERRPRGAGLATLLCLIGAAAPPAGPLLTAFSLLYVVAISQVCWLEMVVVVERKEVE